jgi:hypothetical protein
MSGHLPGEDCHCAYPMSVFGEVRCGKQTVLYERYCDEHIKHVHKRTNIFGDVMPDHSEALWIERR